MKEGEKAASVTAEIHNKAARPNRRQFLKTAAALGTVGALASLPFSANASSADEEASEGPEGSWEETVTPIDVPVPTFHVLVTYDVGGGLTATTSLDLSPPVSGPIHGVWKLSSDRKLQLKVKAFTFDPQSNPSGYYTVRDDLKLDGAGDTYSGSSHANFYDNNGVLTGSANFKVEGKRITL